VEVVGAVGERGAGEPVEVAHLSRRLRASVVLCFFVLECLLMKNSFSVSRGTVREINEA
jgi:hypothetical protein